MTTPSPFPAAEVRRLAAELAKTQSQVAELRASQAVAQAGYSSLDGGTWVVRDSDGNVRQVHGVQQDGTVTSVDIGGPRPPIPADPVLTPVPGGLKVSWSGAFQDDAVRPADFRWVEVHVDLDAFFDPVESTRDAALTARGSVTFATDDYVPHTVRLVARNTSGRSSYPSGAMTAIPAQIGPGDVAPGGIGTIELDDGAVTPPKSGTGVTSNLIPDPGFNDAGWRVKRTVAPWGFVEGPAVGFADADWMAYCGATTTRAVLSLTSTAGVPVIPGETYFIAYDAARDPAGAGLFSLEVKFWNAAKQAVAPTADEQYDPRLAEIRDIGSLPTGVTETRDGQIVIPAKAATMTVNLVRADDTTSTGILYVDRVEMRTILSKSSSGQRVETSPSGVLVYDSAGQPIGSINSDGSMSMLTGKFNDGLTYQGAELADLLNQRARGEVERVDVGYDPSPSTTSEIVWAEFEFDAEQGRSYKLRSGGLIGRGTAPGLRVRYTTNGNRPTTSSAVLCNYQTSNGGTLFLAADIGGLADSGNTTVKMTLNVRSVDGSSAYFEPSDLALGFSAWVEDTGPRKEGSGGVINVGSPGGGGSTPAPVATKKTYTNTWSASWARVFSTVNGYAGTTPLRQGRYDGVNGDWRSAVGFPQSNIASTLSGATIKKVEFYLYAEHWYWNSGGEVWLGTSSLKAPPGNNVYPNDVNKTRFHWHLNKPEGRWVTMGTVGITIAQEFRSGATGTICFDATHPNNNLNDYGRFSGVASANSPKIRITYEKTVYV